MASLLSTALSGTPATRYREKGEEIDVRLKIEENIVVVLVLWNL